MIGGANAANLMQLSMLDQRSARLIAGVQSGALNADEFRELQMMVNGQSQQTGQGVSVEGDYAPGMLGMVQRDQAESRAHFEDMSQAQARFDELYEEYTHGDYHPTTYPENGVESREMEQIDSLYEGLTNGSVTAEEARVVLSTQRDASFQLGVAEQDGTVTGQESSGVHTRLNDAAAQLDRARRGELLPPKLPTFP
ncbi:MAG: hypothetical protein AB1758_00690 [Candidatus Eremiobacterota bacterium]